MLSLPRLNCKFDRNIEIYCLHAFEDLSYPRIAKEYNISVPRVQQICDRVIAHIHNLDMVYIDAISKWEDSTYGEAYFKLEDSNCKEPFYFTFK